MIATEFGSTTTGAVSSRSRISGGRGDGQSEQPDDRESRAGWTERTRGRRRTFNRRRQSRILLGAPTARAPSARRRAQVQGHWSKAFARLPVGGERVALPARAGEGEHQLRPEPLPVRVLGDERLELRNELRMPPEAEVGFDPFLEGTLSRCSSSRPAAAAAKGSPSRSASAGPRQSASASRGRESARSLANSSRSVRPAGTSARSRGRSFGARRRPLRAPCAGPRYTPAARSGRSRAGRRPRARRSAARSRRRGSPRAAAARARRAACARRDSAGRRHGRPRAARAVGSERGSLRTQFGVPLAAFQPLRETVGGVHPRR